MAIIRRASARWTGTGKEGHGLVSTQSGVLKEQNYNFGMRFEDQPGTNPEELIAAAHASCFSMKLAFCLNAAGITAQSIDSQCAIVLDDGVITESRIKVQVKADGLNADVFKTAIDDARDNCPISKSLKATVHVEAQLV